MKVISLLQPWASLLFIERNGHIPRRAAKGWETRSWQPKDEVTLYQIRNAGCFIHASKGWKPYQRDLLKKWPFNEYIKSADSLPFGAIIGKVQFGEIITTDGWITRHNHYEDGAAETPAEEYQFGDYSPGRFAWEIKAFNELSKSIPCKGQLNFWDCPEDILDKILK